MPLIKNLGKNKAALSEEELRMFTAAWERGECSPAGAAKILGWDIRKVYAWRAAAAKQGAILRTLPTPHSQGGRRYGWQDEAPKWPKRREITVKGRSIIIGSDAHFWPGLISTAWRAYCKVSKQIEPSHQILNGDTLDGAKITRHDPIAWEAQPNLSDEIETLKERLDEARDAAPNAERLKTAGNHDTRYERTLAKNVPQMRDVKGSCLQDHIGWLWSWSILVNGHIPSVCPLMIKHAFKGGIHAVYNNVLQAGVSIATGHLHAQAIRAFTDYRGTRYGVDCGTLADIHGPQFFYTMDNPVNWRSGFGVFTFDDKGHLMPPEVCEVQDFPDGYQRAVFRGKVVAEGESYREDIAS
jgi:hypothetical protein